jgi:hypothetical protein
MYARAILAAEKRVNGRKVTHNFNHQEAPVVTLDGNVVEPVSQASDLRSDSWLMRGSLVTVSITLQRNTARHVVIRPRGH